LNELTDGEMLIFTGMAFHNVELLKISQNSKLQLFIVVAL